MWTVRLCATALMPIRLQINRWIDPSRLADGPMGRGDFCFGYTYRLFHGYVSVISPLQAMPDGIPPLVGTVPLRTGTPVAVHVLFMPGTFFFAYYCTSSRFLWPILWSRARFQRNMS